MESRLYWLPGNFRGFLKGINLAPMARAMGGPKINPLASIPRTSRKWMAKINDSRWIKKFKIQVSTIVIVQFKTLSTIIVNIIISFTN
jgi:hypothetical protein